MLNKAVKLTKLQWGKLTYGESLWES